MADDDARHRAPKPLRITERRKTGKSYINRIVTVVNVAGWLLLLFFVNFYVQAMPESENLFSVVYGFQVRFYWDMASLRMAFVAVILSFLFAALGFFLHLMIQRRKNDRFHVPSIMLGLVSAVVLVLFVWKYNIYL